MITLEAKNLNEAKTMWLVSALPVLELPKVALLALENGSENNSIILLAGLSSSEVEEARILFEKALNIDAQDYTYKEENLKNFIDIICSRIVSEELTQYEGAKLIWEACLRLDVRDFHEADSFIYAASEYEDRPDDQEFFSKEIVIAAIDWLKDRKLQNIKLTKM